MVLYSKMGVKDFEKLSVRLPSALLFLHFLFLQAERCTNNRQIKFTRQTLYGVSAANVSFDGVTLTRSRSTWAIKTFKQLCLTHHSSIIMIILFRVIL